MTEDATHPNADECVVEYSACHTFLENLPYAVMLLLGAAILALGTHWGVWTPLAAIGLVVYGVLGSFWIILFLCPHCSSFSLKSCPCGYGVLSARLRQKGDVALFTRKFRRHIPTIVPLWFIPVAIAVASLVKEPTPSMLILLCAFVLDGFILLPWLSKGHGCKNCPQKELCPWMGNPTPTA